MDAPTRRPRSSSVLESPPVCWLFSLFVTFVSFCSKNTSPEGFVGQGRIPRASGLSEPGLSRLSTHGSARGPDNWERWSRRQRTETDSGTEGVRRLDAPAYARARTCQRSPRSPALTVSGAPGLRRRARPVADGRRSRSPRRRSSRPAGRSAGLRAPPGAAARHRAR